MNDGTFLYPGLDGRVARRMVKTRAKTPLDDLHAESVSVHPDAAPAATGGRPVDRQRLEKVRDGVRSIAEACGYPDKLKRKRQQDFERPCGTFLFETMEIVTADAADEAVWSFLSLVLLPEIGPWRFPDRADERLLGKPRNVFRRLWWRAWAVGPDLTVAPPGCEPLGEDEFVNIMERPSLGGNVRTAAALRDGLWRAEASGIKVARSEMMRQIARRLLAAKSNLSFEALTDEQLDELIGSIAVESHAHLAGGRKLKLVSVEEWTATLHAAGLRTAPTGARRE